MTLTPMTPDAKNRKSSKICISSILYYFYLKMPKFCRTFVVSKDEAEKAAIKEKFCYH